MNAIPAKVAGVERVGRDTPPQRDGLIISARGQPSSAAWMRSHMVGGAQAVAALAYGTEPFRASIKSPVRATLLLPLPNRLSRGDVGIDMVAGPSEVSVLADATAKPMVVAADLMAQAEHDPLAACYLVTCDEQFAREVEAGIDILVAQSPRAEDHARLALDNEGTIIGRRRYGCRRRGREHRGA